MTRCFHIVHCDCAKVCSILSWLWYDLMMAPTMRGKERRVECGYCFFSGLHIASSVGFSIFRPQKDYTTIHQQTSEITCVLLQSPCLFSPCLCIVDGWTAQHPSVQEARPKKKRCQLVSKVWMQRMQCKHPIWTLLSGQCKWPHLEFWNFKAFYSFQVFSQGEQCMNMNN